ncbi:MAG: GSCFA domain-containing protein [Bacteroidales bacterium]|nr:GSCFA domain-containing protein [Bacteroidales bacterium]MDD3989224.1 GSCFA domain-containing protein [Bacteroidales bacterium]MDD4638922.1 GSCFA domain-containing protein [Bacteroidales bacterium]
MDLQTIVSCSESPHKISYRDKILFTGSCFASEIGNIMKRLRFMAEVTPFGPMYNPVSVVQTIERIESGTPFNEGDLLIQEDVCKSIFVSSEYSAPSPEEFLTQNNNMLLKLSRHYRDSAWIVVTLGTNRIYTEKRSGRVAANCHKLPSDHFLKSELTINQIYSLFEPVIKRSKGKKWIFTVSPVRHWKDGAHENQLSKATLLLAVDMLQKKNENVYYFPAYEIMMDQLRDYRFYAGDMIHPSHQAVEYIWERFREVYADSSEEDLLKNVRKLNAMEDHRPVFPYSREYLKFENEMRSLRKKIEDKLYKYTKDHNL